VLAGTVIGPNVIVYEPGGAPVSPCVPPASPPPLLPPSADDGLDCVEVPPQAEPRPTNARKIAILFTPEP
jgi:hypothetical protein